MPIDLAADHPFQHISRNVNKLVEQFQKGYSTFRPNDTWAPNVNLYETDEMYLVCIDLAGIDKAKIDLEVSDDKLSIRGSRDVPSFGEPEASVAGEKGKLRVHVMEIDHGAFFREVELPERAEQNKITAHYRNGMLWVELPKK